MDIKSEVEALPSNMLFKILERRWHTRKEDESMI